MTRNSLAFSICLARLLFQIYFKFNRVHQKPFRDNCGKFIQADSIPDAQITESNDSCQTEKINNGTFIHKSYGRQTQYSSQLSDARNHIMMTITTTNTTILQKQETSVSRHPQL